MHPLRRDQPEVRVRRDDPDFEGEWIDLGKQKELALFREICALTADRQPCLLPWLQKRPLQALEQVNQATIFGRAFDSVRLMVMKGVSF